MPNKKQEVGVKTFVLNKQAHLIAVKGVGYLEI